MEITTPAATIEVPKELITLGLMAAMFGAIGLYVLGIYLTTAVVSRVIGRKFGPGHGAPETDMPYIVASVLWPILPLALPAIYCCSGVFSAAGRTLDGLHRMISGLKE